MKGGRDQLYPEKSKIKNVPVAAGKTKEKLAQINFECEFGGWRGKYPT